MSWCQTNEYGWLVGYRYRYGTCEDRMCDNNILWRARTSRVIHMAGELHNEALLPVAIAPPLRRMTPEYGPTHMDKRMIGLVRQAG